MFVNYVDMLGRVKKMKKVEHNIKNTNTYYYVGIRQSDYNMSNGFFADGIAMFSDDEQYCHIRPNQNKRDTFFLPYVERKMNDICRRDSTARFMFYNPMMSYNVSESFSENIICKNDKTLLGMLNDKIVCKNWLLNNGIPIVPFKTAIVQSINSNDFINNGSLVLQLPYGGGGINTYVVDRKNYDVIISELPPKAQCIYSEYIKNSISVNTHVIISKTQTVLSPGSIQIIETIDNHLCYRGADFISFRKLENNIKNKIKLMSLKIADLLRDKGYLGIAGIDFICCSNGNIYCCEINPRFQASTILIDYFLQGQKNQPRSVFELNLQAFQNNLTSSLCFDDIIDYSCFYYYKDDNDITYLQEKYAILKENNILVNGDGVQFDDNNTNKDSYMFRAVFKHAITEISPDYTLWINDNIPIQKRPTTPIELKIALLNQGVRIVNPPTNMKLGVYQSVDIVYHDYNGYNGEINCAYNINYSCYSPYLLNCAENILYYYNTPLGTFNIEVDQLKELSELSQKILYLATDRLRIKMLSGCEYKSLGEGCDFCDLSMATNIFSVKEIISALVELKKIKPKFNHILIGGGTCLQPNNWDNIILVVTYLKNDIFYKDKPISLMSIIPPTEYLLRFKKAGITEVAFNLEISDETIAKQYMRGKHYEKKQYYCIMKQAVAIFGVNNVRSALIVGLDKKTAVIEEIKCMVQAKVLPCLSAFRKLNNAKLNYLIQPSNAYLLDVYINAMKIIADMESDIKEVGPICKHCRNNMLAI